MLLIAMIKMEQEERTRKQITVCISSQVNFIFNKNKYQLVPIKSNVFGHCKTQDSTLKFTFREMKLTEKT